MGLDMYLERKKMAYWHGREPWNHENPNPHNLPDGINFESSEVTQCVTQWRKANQIHNYFVNVVGDCEDDCKPIPVEKEDIEKLLGICKEILEKLKTTVNNDALYWKIVSFDAEWKAPAKLARQCEEMLPTQDGFFFGSTEYDAGYFFDLDFTVRNLSRVLKEWDADDKWEYQYVASW